MVGILAEAIILHQPILYRQCDLVADLFSNYVCYRVPSGHGHILKLD